MITNSNIRPTEKITIESIDEFSGLCTVYLIDLNSIKENTQEQENPDIVQTSYTYNSYREKIRYRPNLKSRIENKFDVWLNWAKEQEEKRNTPVKSTEEVVSDISKEVDTIKETVYADEIIPEDFEGRKEFLIRKSKLNLVQYLENNPMPSTCHNNTLAYYNVTAEKQAQFTSKFTAHQVLLQSGVEDTMTWNSTGSPCEPWTDAECIQFIGELNLYITPLVSRQQHMEVELQQCTTIEELDNVDINFVDGVSYLGDDKYEKDK